MEAAQRMKNRRPVVPFGLSLAAGIMILVGGTFISANRETAGLAPLAFTSGAVVLIGGTLMLVAPRSHTAVGLVLLVASAVAFFAYGWGPFFGAGVALGIAAGILAVQWESHPTVMPARGP